MHVRTTYRWVPAFLAVLLLSAFFVAACGDDDDSGGGETPADTENGETPANGAESPTEEANGDAAGGGELTVQYIEFQSFDPHFSSFAQDIGHQGFVFRGLYKLNQDNEPVPEMAAGDAQVSEDGTTVTVELKEGLTWSDGDDLLAEDFAEGIIRTCNYQFAGGYQYLLSNIAGCDEYYDENNADLPEEELAALRDGVGVTAVDDTTLEFELENPQPTFPIILSLWMTYPVPVHQIQPDQEWPASPTDLVFNGPFVVEEYQAGQHMIFARNEEFGGETPAQLDRVTFRYIDDNLVSNNAYRGDELDMAVANVAELETLQSEFPDELVSQASPSTIALQVQMEDEVLANEQVRLALSRAINREALTQVVFQGAHIPTTTWVPPDVLGGDASTDMFADEIGFDEEGARQALADAGYPDGEGFPEFSILVRDSENNRSMAEFLQGQFNEILGITTTIEIVDGPARAQRFTDEQFELFPGGWIQDYPDPENWIVGLFDTEGPLNHYNCSNPEIDSLIEEARFNDDNEERMQQYRELNELISAGMCGAIPMYHQGKHYLVGEHVGGAREFAGPQDRVLAGDWAPEEWSLEE